MTDRPEQHVPPAHVGSPCGVMTPRCVQKGEKWTYFAPLPKLGRGGGKPSQPVRLRAHGVRALILLILSSFILSTIVFGAPVPPPPVPQPQVKVDDIGFCKPYNWLFGDWVKPPRMPVLADVNGDGYADLLYASPRDKNIDVAINGHGWKPLRGQTLIGDLPQTVQAFCAGHFGGKTIDLAILGSEGGLLKTLSNEKGEYPTKTELGAVADIPGKNWLLAGKLSSSSLDDIVLVNASGRVEVFNGGGLKLHGYVLGTSVVDAAIGDVLGNGKSELAIRSGRQVVLYKLGDSAMKLAAIPVPKGQESLAIGDINADGKADLLVDGQVFLGPDFKKTVSVAGWDKFTKPVIALMGDVVGRHRADLIIQHQGKEYFGSTEDDCDLYIMYFRGDSDWDADGLSNEDEAKIGSDPLDRDTSHDGILDGWKVHGFAGVDFPGMGASPLHKDVFVMNLPFDNVPVNRMEAFMRDRVVPFFAQIPYTNLDGKKGFAVHWITQYPVLPIKGNEGKGWGQIADETFPRDKIGLYHWMLINGLDGGGQSGQLADSGSTGMGSWWHEFGHQLGLSHTGPYENWAPTYTSLMNYSYSYQFDGDGKKVHFSSGELAKLVLNESHLPGKVPYPVSKLQFLTGPPYHLHIQAAGKDATYIDWGWSGEFADRKTRANITFGYAVGGGQRLQPSGKQEFNYDGPYELMTDYQASLAEHRGKLYMLTASRGPIEPTAPRPKSEMLVLQTYLGKHAWSAPVEVAPEVTNDPCAVSDGKIFYIFYPTAIGVFYRYGSPSSLSTPALIPNSYGAYPSAVNWKGTLYLFLYRGPNKTILYRTVQGKNIGPELDLGVSGTIPPGLAVDTIHDQLLLGTAAPLGRQQYRWQLIRLEWDADHAVFHKLSASFVGGEKANWAGNRRPTLIFNSDRSFGPDGRLYWIAAGLAQPLSASTGTMIAQTIGYKDVNDGWLLWRYYDEWTNTRSGIGAAWFDGDITLATTWASGSAGGDGGVFCAYNGAAIGNTDMGDFDDVSLMANFGMSRSIGTFAVMPPEK